MIKDRLIDLLYRRQMGELSLPEHRELKELLDESESDSDLAAAIEEFFNTSLGFKTSTYEKSLNTSLTQLKNKISALGNNASGSENKSGTWRKYMAVAASVAALMVMLVYVYLNNSSKAERHDVVSTTQKGSRSNIILPDGTKVWINSDSRLTYNSDYGKSRRDVYLVGEAYFDVAEDKNRPYIVHTQTMDIKALGTAFNVRAYSSESFSQTTLVKGSIEVRVKDENRAGIVLKPNEKIIVKNDFEPGNVENLTQHDVDKIRVIEVGVASDSNLVETQWIQARLAFKNEQLKDIALQLERWYGVSVSFTNEKLKTNRYSGSFKSKTIGEVLEALHLTGGLNYKIENDSVTITP